MKKLIKKIKRFIKRIIKKLRKPAKKPQSTPKPKTEEQLKRELRKQKREERIQSIMAKTGWTRKETIENFEEAKDRFEGLTYKEYEKARLYAISPEEQPAALNRFREEQEMYRQQKERCISVAMDAMGWNYEQAKKHVEETKKRTGCKYGEYVWYRFYRLTPEQQDTFCLKTISAKVSDKYNVNREFARMLDNKEQTDIYFNDFIRRPWCVNTKVSEEDFINKFAGSSRIIYKPIEGIGGFGIESFSIDENNISEIYGRLKDMPEGIVEEYVVQHPDMSALSPSSVNTIRVVTVVSKRKPVTPDGRYMDISYACVRMGGGKGIVDNLHSGGLAAVIDINTGVLITDGADYEGNPAAVHPQTGVTIKGYKIPLFDQVIQFVRDLCAMELVEGSIGWDIAITENGPVLIEANVGPGIGILQKPYAEAGIGMRHIIQKYL